MKEPPQRLGRGLAALLGEANVGAIKLPIGEIACDLLEPNPFQPRGTIDPADLDELAASIRAKGLLQPLLVRPHPKIHGRFQIIAGERRWRAAAIAGLDRLPCLVRPLEDAESAAAALVENLQRRDLNAIEEAEGFSKLIGTFGLTQDELGVAVGKSRSHVANILRLLTLPPAVIQHVRSGTLSAGHARAALACADPEAAAAQMIADGLNVRQAENLRQQKPGNADGKAAKPSSLPDPDRAAIEADLAERLGLRVEISFNGRGGVVRLHYQTLDQLDYVVGRLGRV